MQPAGGRWERFAARGKGGMLYRPTDIELAPDGSLYICGWGGDYHYDRSDEGSWLFRIRYKENASDDEGEYLESNKRETAYSDWSVEQLIADLTSATIPVWRVAAQDELVRRGELIVPKLRQAVESNRLSTSQETWVLWAIGRISNAWSQQAFICQLAAPTKNGLSAAPLNQRIQAIRILATFNVSPKDSIERYNLLTSCLSDPEPRVRHEAIQSLWRSDGTSLIPALVDRLAVENDRIVFYTGWQALRALASTDSRRTLLADKRSGVRLASMLSLQEDHELTLDEAISLAENDEDSQVQAWAMTYALNPSPPKKMPNSQSRIEQEESISMRDLIKRAKNAKTPKTKALYAQLISRSTYRDDDWGDLLEYFLANSEHEALLLRPLSKRKESLPHLWNALSGRKEVQQAAIRGLSRLAKSEQCSPEEVAAYLLGKLRSERRGKTIVAVAESLSKLGRQDRGMLRTIGRLLSHRG